MEVFTCTGCNDGRGLPGHPLTQAGRQHGGMLDPGDYPDYLDYLDYLSGRQPGGMLDSGGNFPISDKSRPYQPLPSDIVKRYCP